VDRDGLDGLAFHVDIPDLHCEVVAREDVPAIVAEAYVGDGGDDLGEERSRGWVFLLLEFCILLACRVQSEPGLNVLTLGMLVA